MSGITEEALRRIIQEELARQHTCRFSGISDDDASKLGPHVRSIAMLGDGNLDKGFDVISDNHKWIKDVREKGSWASKIAFGLVISAVVGAAIVAFIEGMKLKIRSGSN